MPVTEVNHPPGYPVEWEADVLLSDGAVARLRPIRPDDAELLVQFYDRVSPESKYLRFFAPYPRLSRRDVVRFTQLDYIDRVAFIVVSGGRMIGVGRYERLEDDRAEVAFLVEDAHQGRGVAQLLLEHLAEAARERGITGFTADVLPENRRMAQVFADAGYRVKRGIEDGVLSVEFPILPTDTSVGVMERREHRAEGASMQRLLTPRQVAIVGPGRRAQGLANSLLEAGFRGRVVAVSTDDVPVLGVTVVRSLATVTTGIDLVLLTVPVGELGAAVIDAAHRGAHGMVVLSGSAIGPEDNRTVINLARAYGVRAVGPDALGLINTDPDVALNASPGPMPRSGAVGVFCQSAAIGVGLLATAVRQHLGLSSFISTGDVADVTANDVMQFWEDDEATRVCMLSLERIGNPRKFSRIVRRLARRKPVLVFSPGQARRTGYSTDRAGRNQAPSAAVDALFRQSGVTVVHRREVMFDIAQILARQPLPNGPRVRVITNSSSLSHQLARSVDRSGLLPAGDVVVTDPTDPLERVAHLAWTAMSDDTCDSVVCAIVGLFAEEPDETRWALSQLAAESTKPLVACFLDFTEPDRSEEGPDLMATLPIVGGPVDAIDALAAVSAYAHWRERDPGAVPMLDRMDPAAGQRLVNRVLAAAPEGRLLTDAEAAELLGAYGIDLVPRRRVSTLAEAVAAAEEFGWGVVLKASSAALRARSDLASVFRHLDDEGELTEAWRDLRDLIREAGEPGRDLDDLLAEARPVVQPMAPAGVALTLGSVEDDAFGPIVSLGLEGIASELLGDVVYRVPPLTTVDAKAMVRDLRAAETLFGRSGGPQADVGAVEELLHRLAELADALPQLSSVTLSPCLAAPQGITVLGASVRVSPSSTQRDPMARSLT